jgi:hypothetical protein
MSSMMEGESDFAFTLQTGVCAWEDSSPISDWHRKTLSVFVLRPALTRTILWPLVSLWPSNLQRVFRVHIAHIPVAATAAQRRSVISRLCVDPNGFRDTTIRPSITKAVVISELYETSAVDLNALSAYQSTALIEVDETAPSANELGDLIGRTVSDLSGTSISRLLDRMHQCVVCRVCDKETFSVIQVIGPQELIDPPVQYLSVSNVRQIHDVRNLGDKLFNRSG